MDLFAGTGSLGLEALSRGAKKSHFVEGSHKAVQIIKKNISKLQVSEHSLISKKRVNRFIRTCEDKFDLIFIDPPYGKNLVNETIELIYENDLLTENAQVVVERFYKEDIADIFRDKITSDKNYKTTSITILKK